MNLRLIPLALACAVTAGCTTPETRLSVDGGESGTGFVFVSESYDLYPARRAEGEAWRQQDLRTRLTSAGVCSEGYEVEERQEGRTEGRFFNGDIYRVIYRGRCAAQSPMRAPATSAPTSPEPILSEPLPDLGPRAPTPAPAATSTY